MTGLSQYYMVPQRVRKELSAVVDAIIDDLSAKGRIVRQIARDVPSLDFRRTWVTPTKNGMVLRDSTGYEIAMEWWKDEYGRDRFRCIAVKDGLHGRDQTALMELYGISGLSEVPVYVDVVRIDGTWSTSDLPPNFDLAFPLPVWLDAMIAQSNEP